MDQSSYLKYTSLLLLLCALLAPSAWGAGDPAVAARKVAKAHKPAWAQRMDRQLQEIDEAHPGELGVFIKDLSTGDSVSLRGEETWYLASGIKVPVAIAVLRNIEMGEFSLDTQVHLVESDYVDGAGETNWHGPGTPLTVNFLMKQMITRSDNTATDLLIRLVGLDQVNGLLRELVPEGFGKITTLADVRRHAYSGFHPDAFRLTGKDFFILKKQSEEQKRIEALAGIIGVTTDDFAMTDLDSAFTAYYATNLNGGTLSAYGQLLEALVEGRALRPESTQYLLGLLKAVQTGDMRIKAGLPPFVEFAHKTGTQHLRICDLGLAMVNGEQGVVRSVEDAVATKADGTQVIVTACNRGFVSISAAEAALKAVGEALTASGLFTRMEIGNAVEEGPDPKDFARN